MKTKNILFLIALLISTGTFAQKEEKYVPSMPPPQFFKSGKTYHFESEKKGLKISLDLQRKTAMATNYSLKIEYPDKRIVSEKGTVYMRENYDLGVEERLKASDDVMVSCQPFTPKRQTKTNYLEICVGDDVNKDEQETGKIFVSITFLKPGYPSIDLENASELFEL